ncbi:DUF962 domain-containing protein [Frankia sp. R82]|uniref:DUF962 domain-containing protein n=1 Tax=Frankia sp. R82 TaxID=2950553 RepID=UPI0020431CD2|nr:DUF962 domain-containing protein [Frankia sp. R82]MCM3883790.1 DUF962 domain-containing protein [Frankia sp. R82]
MTMENVPSRSLTSARPDAAPTRDASFATTMAYYRSEHRTRGIRLTHLIGIPGAALSLPLLVARPSVGVPLFTASWALQVLGHVLFEHNRPALTRGPIIYQLCGLAFWCEEVADLLAGRGLPAATP